MRLQCNAVGVAIGWLGALGASAEFTYGVAAGDVTDQSVVVWTRTDTPRAITLRLALNAELTLLDRTVAATTDAASDNTVKLDLAGLEPATDYFYCFQAADDATIVSPIGRFRTSRALDDDAPVSFVFSGDTNYSVAPFGVASSLAREAADVFIWFGDTIYADAPSGGLGVAQTLADYRDKYRQIRSDSNIRAALHAMPIWVGGDDHEVKNDYAGLDPALSAAQKLSAYQAFFEYMPIRPVGDPDDPYRTYRRFRNGNLAEFFFLDARQYREDSAKVACGGAPDPLGTLVGPLLRNEDCINELKEPRAFLGRTQLDWLKVGLAESDAPWKFVVNNVPFSYLGAYPYDRWDGYDAERKELLQFINTQGISGVVILTTDIHANAYVPDTSVYFERRRRDYTLPGDVPVPEVITGPLGNATARQSITRAATGVLGDALGNSAVELAQGLLTFKLWKADRIAFIDTNKVSYIRIDVNSPNDAVVTYRGLPPNEAQDASIAARTMYESKLNQPPSTACAVPVVGMLALMIVGYSRAGRRLRRQDM